MPEIVPRIVMRGVPSTTCSPVIVSVNSLDEVHDAPRLLINTRLFENYWIVSTIEKDLGKRQPMLRLVVLRFPLPERGCR